MEKVKFETFLEDMSFHTEYEFITSAEENKKLIKIAEKRGIKLPAHDLSIFKARYAFVDRANLNDCVLPSEEVEKSLPTLIGKSIDINHLRKRVVGFWIDANLNKKNGEITAIGIFFKSSFDEDYDIIKDLLEKGKAGVSFEAWGHKKYREDGNYDLVDIEFAGGAILIDEEPAFKDAAILEMSQEKQERILELAKVMTKPEHFLAVKEDEEEVIEEKVVKEEEVVPPTEDELNALEDKGEEPEQEDANVKFVEEAKYYIFDAEAIYKAVSEVECPSCKEKGMYMLQMIDFEKNNARVKCICDAVLKLDLTPSAKVEKKGRSVSSIAEEEKEKSMVEEPEDYIQKLETFEGSADRLEELFVNDVEYINAEMKDDEKITYEERKKISDKMFAVIKIVKNMRTGESRKIRMFPIHDPAHVRNALARLEQSAVDNTLKKLGVSIDIVKRKILKRAKELNMSDLLKRYEESTVEEQAKLFKETVEENAELKTQVESKTAEVEEAKVATEEAGKQIEEKDAEIAKLTEEKDEVTKRADTAEEEIATRDKEIRDAEIARRREELGEEIAKDISDDDIMDDTKFENVKLKKENAALKDKAGEEDPVEDKDLDKGSKDKDTDDPIVEAGKRVREKAYGKDEEETQDTD